MEILEILEKRFEKNSKRHPDLKWCEVLEKLDDKKIRVLEKMEETGGEPDVVKFSEKIIFVDFVKETPKERRGACYDLDARVNRKKFPPESSVEEMIKEIGCELMNEEIYRFLQEIENFDLKTSSWIATPKNIRELGGALFCDKRYETTFVYHNGADSYYSSRGFRGYLELL